FRFGGERFQSPPGAEGFTGLALERLAAAVRIEQLALRGGAQQRLVLVLAVDVDQELARLAQLRKRRGVAVDEAARAAGAIEGSPQDDSAGIARQICFIQPGRKNRT